MNFADGQMTRYPVLRAVLREDLSVLDEAALEGYVAQAIPGVTAEELEISFGQLGRSVGRGLGQVGNVLGRAAPGAISGAMQGVAMGAALGPYGMLAGAALGAVGGGIVSYSQSQQQQRQQQRAGQAPQAAAGQAGAAQRQAQPSMARPTGPAGAPTQVTPRRQQGIAASPGAVAQTRGVAPVQQRPAAAASQIAAVSQLLQLLSRPEVMQALLSLSLGPNGRQRIQVGEHVIAPVQMLNAVELVASGMPLGSGGGAVESDPFDAIDMTEALLGEMARTPPETHPFYQVLDAHFGVDEGMDGDAAGYPEWSADLADAIPPPGYGPAY